MSQTSVLQPACHPAPSLHHKPDGVRGLGACRAERAQKLLLESLEERVTLEKVAAALDLSVCHFVRVFRQHTGEPPARWLAAHRVERAKALLAESALSLCDIAHSCGFYDQSHFTKVFARSVGHAPGAWRRRLRKATAGGD